MKVFWLLILLLLSFTADYNTNGIHDNILSGPIIPSNPSSSTLIPMFANDKISRNTIEIYDPIDIVGIRNLHKLGYYGEGVVVAVVDTGINKDLPIFSGQLLEEKSFVTKANGYENNEGPEDLHGHGTKVSSIILGNESGFYQGGAPLAKLVSLKVADGRGFITTKGVVEAIDYAISKGNIDVMSMSLSEPEEGVGEDSLEAAVRRAAEAGILVLVSAGNLGTSSSVINQYTMGSPSSSPHVITVGATDSNLNIASFSSNGPTMSGQAKPDLVAPGISIPVVSRSGSLTTAQGTSFSTPLTAGSAAVIISYLKEQISDVNNGLVKSLLTGSAQDRGYDWSLQGNGVLNVTQAWSDFETRASDNDFSNIFPNKVPSFQYPSIPVGEKVKQIVTLTSSEFGSWSFNKVEGNISQFMSESNLAFSSFDNQYNSLLSIDIFPNSNISPGKYLGEIILNTPSNTTKSLTLEFEAVSQSKGKILIDLIHSPWDSILLGNERIERMFSGDLKDIVNTFREKNYWIDEVLDGDLNYDLIKEYDIIFMPSALTSTFPSYFDHEITRNTELKSNEIMALHEFIQNGGNLILDFGGTTPARNNFERLEIREDMLSLLQLIGLKSVNGNEFVDDIQTSVPFNPSEFNLFESLSGYTVRAGGNLIENGLPIRVLDSQNSAVLSLGKGGRVFVANARNWRDDTAYNFGQNGFVSKIIEYLEGNLLIKNVHAQFNDDTTVVNLQFNTTIKSDLLNIKLFDSEGKILSFKSIMNKGNGLIQLSLSKITDVVIKIDIEYDGLSAIIKKYIGGSLPEITVEDYFDQLLFDDFIFDLNTIGSHTLKINVIDVEPINKKLIDVMVNGIFSDFIQWEVVDASLDIYNSINTIRLKISNSVYNQYSVTELSELLDSEILQLTISVAQYDEEIIKQTYTLKLVDEIITSLSTSSTNDGSNYYFYIPALAILVFIKKYNKYNVL